MTVPASMVLQSYPETNVFGFTAVSPVTGRIAWICRRGAATENSEGSGYIVTSDDGGNTLSAPREFWVEAGKNVTNFAGGYAANGDLVVHAVIYSSNNAWADPADYTFESISTRISDDDGETFGVAQVLDTGAATVFSAYGKSEVLDNGKLAQAWYSQEPNVVTIVESEDHGKSWTPLAALPLIGTVTETDILALGDGRVMAVSRVDSQEFFKLSTSKTNGEFWTYRGEIKSISHAVATGGVNESPCWLETFTVGEVTVVAMCYYKRNLDAGSQQLRVTYCTADEIIAHGRYAFTARADVVILDNLPGGIGYGSMIHIDALALGWFIGGTNMHMFGLDHVKPDVIAVVHDFDNTHAGVAQIDIYKPADVIRFDGIAPTKSVSGEITTYDLGTGTVEASLDGTYY